MIRQTSLRFQSQAISLPCFFPSISSVKANARPIDYLSVLVALAEPQFLISAYDIEREDNKEELQSLLEKARALGQVVLLDSGNYERFWKQDDKWCPADLARVLALSLFPVAFCFDNQAPPSTIEDLVTGIEDAVLREQKQLKGGTVVPIIHARTEQLPEAAVRVAERLYPLMVAIPERKLGAGILTRARTVRAVRSALNRLPTYVPLHILGTGNPRSILILAASGADSFDGLEWCQTTVDAKTGNLHHFQHRELFLDNCTFCKPGNLSYATATLGHNLLFMRRWMAKIQEALHGNAINQLISDHLPPNFVSDLQLATGTQ